MKEAYAGDAMEMMCPTCLTPRDPEKKKCFFCKSTEDAVHCTQPMASMVVDGKLWELRFEADGTYHWEAEGVTQEEKDAAMVDISALAQSPSPSMDPKEASFADQVPQSLRIKLRDQVVTNAPDPALLEALAKRNERPHIKQEEDQNEGQKVFHPGAAKAMKLRQATLCDPIEPPKVDLAKVEEAVTLTTEVLGEMQTGALSVADKEALGAKVLRQLDMEHYKECLKRSYLDGPGASILQAQTSIEKAREQNLAMQARGQKMAADLHLIPEPRSFWTDRARSAFEQNVFAPEFEMDGAMAIDHEAVITEYKEMKGFLQSSNTRQFAPKLYSELPETPVKELDLDGTMVGPNHPAFKLALLTRMCNHLGELRQFGGVWRLAYGRFNPPKWAKQLKREELIALETRTHPADLRNWNFTPCLYTEEDVKKQVEAGLRPAPEKIRGGFWAPYDEERYWQRQTQTWTLPALFHVYGNGWTMKELYGIWCEMPLMIQRSRRGQGETAKEHQANLQKTKDEVQQFLDANNLGRPQSPAEWRQCYRELGKFLAMRAFLTNTPQVVMEIPVAPITDDREHMIMRAICDERISLPLDAFKEHPRWLGDAIPRSTGMLKWMPQLQDLLYAKLGYSAAAIEAMDLNPFGGHVNLTAQGAKILGEEPAHSGHPNPGERQSGYSPAPFITIEGDDGKDYDAERKPPITVNNVVSACGKDYMRKSYPGGKRYAFWGRMECGLVLSSVSPWEMVQKEKGVTCGGYYCCKWCKGFWKGKMGSSRFLQITSGNVVLQMVLDEPPERLYNRWVKDRIEFYKRLEPTAPLRDVPLKVDPNPVHRLRFSISNGLGNVSDAIWNIVLANPEKAGLEGIHHVADKHIGYWVHQGRPPLFCSVCFCIEAHASSGLHVDSFATRGTTTWAHSHQSVGTHTLDQQASSGDRPQTDDR